MAADDLAAAWPRSLSPQPGLCPHSPHQGQLQSSAPQPALAVARCTDGPVLVVMLQFDLAKSITHYTARPRFVNLCRDQSFGVLTDDELILNVYFLIFYSNRRIIKLSKCSV